MLNEQELDLIAKSLGWRLEFLKESPSLGFSIETEEIEDLLLKLQVKTIVDPDSGEVQLLKR